MRFTVLIGLVLAFATSAFASPVGKSPYEKVVYLSAAATATQSAAYAGNDYTSPKGFYTGTLFQVPANTVIEEVYAIVDVALSGPSALKVGDANDDDGFITYYQALGNLGIAYSSLGELGAYMRTSTGNISGVFKAKKYYSAATNIILTVTGAATAGKVKLLFKGYTLN
jgi:hypothetical protein